MTPLKFFVITDTHYFATKLGCRGDEYKKFMMYEQKCFAETEAINKAAFKWLEKADEADIVLIAGDLSFNGEKESHLEFIELLNSLKNSGKKIYVITAGHDYNDTPFAFDETGRLTPEGTKREELFDLYYEYGFKDAIAVDKESLSYVAQLSDGIRLLALNNDGNDEVGHTYPPGQIEWIKEQTKKAREENQLLIAMNHYPLLAGSPIFELLGEGDIVMKNAREITTMLADEGVHLCFTGHMHNQSIKSKTTEKGNIFWDVCTGSLIGCPASMRIVEVIDEHTIDIKTLPVPEFEWDMQGLTNDEYFQRQFDMMINSLLDAMEHDPKRFLDKLRAYKKALEKPVSMLGKKLNSITVGKICRLLCIKCPASLKNKRFREIAVEVVRNIFVGDMPFVEGTDEYTVIMALLRRFSPIIKQANKKIKVNGRDADLVDIIRNTVGKYGVSDNNAVITF